MSSILERSTDAPLGGGPFASAGGRVLEQLRQVHARAARSAERWTPGAGATIALHYERCGMREPAYEYALGVAAEACATHAYAAAVDFLRVAERNAVTIEQTAEAQARLAEIAERQGRLSEATTLCDAALHGFAESGDQPRVMSVRRMRERLRSALGAPAQETLESVLALDGQACALGLQHEHAALLLMISQLHGRLGHRPMAELIAQECVRIAEQLSEPLLLAESLNRLGASRHEERPAQAAALYERALELFRSTNDDAGQARCHNNLGIIHTRAGKWMRAEAELESAVACAERTETLDSVALYALNLGVVHLRGGRHARARELFGEAIAAFGTTSKRDLELYALFNLAHLEREVGEAAIAAELYDVTESMARIAGLHEVEVGSIAGAGVMLAERGETAGATAALRRMRERMPRTTGWFQGRELAETLGVLLAVPAAGDEAFALLDAAIARGVEAEDLYAVAWMVMACAGALSRRDRNRMRRIVRKTLRRIDTMPFDALRQRCNDFLEATRM